MKIFLDDQIDTVRKSWIPDGYVGVRNFAEFRKLIEETCLSGERIEALSFDNDLGEGETEGWEVAKWLTVEHPELFMDQPEKES